eukprot:UN30554
MFGCCGCWAYGLMDVDCSKRRKDSDHKFVPGNHGVQLATNIGSTNNNTNTNTAGPGAGNHKHNNNNSTNINDNTNSNNNDGGGEVISSPDDKRSPESNTSTVSHIVPIKPVEHKMYGGDTPNTAPGEHTGTSYSAPYGGVHPNEQPVPQIVPLKPVEHTLYGGDTPNKPVTAPSQHTGTSYSAPYSGVQPDEMPPKPRADSIKSVSPDPSTPESTPIKRDHDNIEQIAPSSVSEQQYTPMPGSNYAYSETGTSQASTLGNLLSNAIKKENTRLAQTD